MRLVASLCLLSVLWFGALAPANADSPTPAPAATIAPAPTTAATSPVILPTPIPPTDTPPVLDSTPVAVARERSTPVSTISAPAAAQPTAGPETQSTYDAVPGTTPSGAPSAPPVQATPSSGVAGIPPSSGTTGSLPPSAPVTVPGPGDSYNPIAAQAPSQLSCTSKHHPVSAPFLASPYQGWTEIVSFVDHDRPDYEVDGTIVLANGLTATAADGQASDLFPAYWSPALRQYVNYDGHNGYDLDISYQPVLAAAAGTVEYAGWNESDPYSGYGQMILINHHNGYVTLYGHLSRLEVKTGDVVSQGQEIGISGTTGHSSGPHLHFSVFHDCHVTDPYGWTGSGTDPLTAFDGERAAYLWLPGRDPLLLNPPPDWPTYPTGLHLPIAASNFVGQAGQREIPPADRLLLLDLPAPEHAAAVSPGVALARTQAWITEEAGSVELRLRDLERAGVVDGFQLVPSAGAIWIRGRATASQLESLPGVASLTGVQASDLEAAQAGLAHAILIQIAPQHAPSLWPLGFRSGLHAWRPISSVVEGDAMVAGFALPGARVIVSLRRDGIVPAAAITTSDQTSGGFAVMLHDNLGDPVAVRAGDTVEFLSGGRTTRMRLAKLRVAARASHIAGIAPPGSSVTVSTLANGLIAGRSTLVAGTTGSFEQITRGESPAGTLVVSNVTDAAGDEESATGFAPGIDVTEGSNEIRGWTVGRSPRLTIMSGRRVIVDLPLAPSWDGSFDKAVRLHGRALVLTSGDSIRVGSTAHGHRVSLAALLSPLSLNTPKLRIGAPTGTVLHIRVNRPPGRAWTQLLRVTSPGATLKLPGGPAVVGETVSLRYVTPRGDIVEAVDELRGLTVDRGTPVVSGSARPGALLNITETGREGRVRAQAFTAADSRTGSFRAVLTNASGDPVSSFGPLHLLVREDGVSTLYIPPALALRYERHSGSFRITGPRATRLTLGLLAKHGKSQIVKVTEPSSGRLTVHIAAPRTGTPRGATVTWTGQNGLSVVRSIVIAPLATSSLHRASCAGRVHVGSCARAVRRSGRSNAG